MRSSTTFPPPSLAVYPARVSQVGIPGLIGTQVVSRVVHPVVPELAAAQRSYGATRIWLYRLS